MLEDLLEPRETEIPGPLINLVFAEAALAGLYH